MTLTVYGLKEWGLALVAALVLLSICTVMIFKGWTVTGSVIGAFVLIVFCAFAAFFRNPCRLVPQDVRLLVSPADGVVKDIAEVDDFNLAPFTGKAKRVGIFLSVLNVHVNRAPADLAVESTHYREGEYLDARNPQAGQRNEAKTISGTATCGSKQFPMAIRQISGAIARRIVCPVEAGRKLAKGEVYGMIKFGSRTELYLPTEGVEICVKPGEVVRGGQTVIAILTDTGK